MADNDMIWPKKKECPHCGERDWPVASMLNQHIRKCPMNPDNN